MSDVQIVSLALGVFFGNWLFVSLVSKRSFKDGFFVGIIAMALVFLFTIIPRLFF